VAIQKTEVEAVTERAATVPRKRTTAIRKARLVEPPHETTPKPTSTKLRCKFTHVPSKDDNRRYGIDRGATPRLPSGHHPPPVLREVTRARLRKGGS
jgi:hypothetical protein